MSNINSASLPQDKPWCTLENLLKISLRHENVKPLAGDAVELSISEIFVFQKVSSKMIVSLVVNTAELLLQRLNQRVEIFLDMCQLFHVIDRLTPHFAHHIQVFVEEFLC